MRQLSQGEELFFTHCKCYKLEPLREYAFSPPRKWRSDFAFPEAMILVEIEGGTWNHGRHSRHKGFSNDLEKYNKAALMGFRVLRFTTDQVVSGYAIDTVLEALRVHDLKEKSYPNCASCALNATATAAESAALR
jgi:very-short-patch-repair endonuclease